MTDTLAPALDLDAPHVQSVLSATDRPYVSLKAAVTLDGKIASRHGESKWITGEAARAAGHRLRAQHTAILVGINTVLADDPQLTVRLGSATHRNPARVVLDSRARTPVDARCLVDDGTARIIVVGSQATTEHVAALERGGVQVLRCPTPRPSPRHFLPHLRERGIDTVLVEGGAQVHADLIAHHAADAVFLFLAGRVMGDAEAPAWCATFPGENRLADAAALELAAPVLIGTDVLIRGRFKSP